MVIVLTAIVDQSQLLRTMFMVMGMMVPVSISMRMHYQLSQITSQHHLWLSAEHMTLGFIERIALLKESMHTSDKSGKILIACTTIKLLMTQRQRDPLQSGIRLRLHFHSH